MQRCVRDVDDLGRKLIISGAKTQAGNRRLSIPEALRDHFAALCAGKLPTEPLFAQDRPGPKKPRSTTSLHRAVQRICKAAGVTMICTHSLRGMNAELQLEGGIAEDVLAKSLGHKYIRITKSDYVSRDTQDAISAKKTDIDISKYSDLNLPPTQNTDAESFLAQLGPEVAAPLRTLLATARAAPKHTGKIPSPPVPSCSKKGRSRRGTVVCESLRD